MSAAVSIAPAAPLFVVVASCACGCRYDAHAWKCLAYVGIQEDGAGGELELRNCGCASTLAIEVTS